MVSRWLVNYRLEVDRTWKKAAVVVALVTAFTDPANICSRIPAAVIGTWADCRFGTGCSTNDIVYSSSSNGVGRIAVVYGIRLTFCFV